MKLAAAGLSSALAPAFGGCVEKVGQLRATTHFPTPNNPLTPRDEWTAPLWLVTHVDLHRTVKVQAFLKFLKAEAEGWDT